MRFSRLRPFLLLLALADPSCPGHWECTSDRDCPPEKPTCDLRGDPPVPRCVS